MPAGADPARPGTACGRRCTARRAAGLARADARPIPCGLEEDLLREILRALGMARAAQQEAENRIAVIAEPLLEARVIEGCS
jgi:hypothetical protein